LPGFKKQGGLGKSGERQRFKRKEEKEREGERGVIGGRRSLPPVVQLKQWSGGDRRSPPAFIEKIKSREG